MASETQGHSAPSGHSHDAHEHGHFGPEMWVIPEASGLVADVNEKQRTTPSVFRLAFFAGIALTILGVVGFVMKLVSYGFSDHRVWGFYIAAFAFVFTLTASAPLAACAFRFTKSHWRRPLSRIAEIFSLVSIVNILLFIPALIALPDIGVMTESGEQMVRRSIWFQELINPAAWLLAGMIGLSFCSVAILWVAAMPDMAQSRAHVSGFRASLYRTLAGSWYGTKRQWQVQKGGLAILGALYFMMVVFVQFLIVSDFGMAMIPGWKDSILPPFYTVISFQGGLAMILLIAYILRRWGGYRELIGQAPFWAASKILLGLTLLHTYHLFAFFITYWYGRLEVEQAILIYLMFDSYSGIFWAQLFFTFFIPVPDSGIQPRPPAGLGRASGGRVHHHRPDAVAHPHLRRGLRRIAGGAGRAVLPAIRRLLVPGPAAAGSGRNLPRHLGHLPDPGCGGHYPDGVPHRHEAPAAPVPVGSERGFHVPAGGHADPRPLPGAGQTRSRAQGNGATVPRVSNIII